MDEPETGVVTRNLLAAIDEIRNQTLVIGDSRRGLKHWPHIIYKMNANELTQLTGKASEPSESAAHSLSCQTGQPVFVTKSNQETYQEVIQDTPEAEFH